MPVDNMIARDLIVGVVGSVVGALLLATFAFGLRFTSNARKRYRDEFRLDMARLLEPSIPARMDFIHSQFLSVFRPFLMGMLAVALQGVASTFPPVGLGLGAAAMVLFCIALGRCIRYQRMYRIAYGVSSRTPGES